MLDSYPKLLKRLTLFFFIIHFRSDGPLGGISSSLPETCLTVESVLIRFFFCQIPFEGICNMEVIRCAAFDCQLMKRAWALFKPLPQELYLLEFPSVC